MYKFSFYKSVMAGRSGRSKPTYFETNIKIKDNRLIYNASGDILILKEK